MVQLHVKLRLADTLFDSPRVSDRKMRSPMLRRWGLSSTTCTRTHTVTAPRQRHRPDDTELLFQSVLSAHHTRSKTWASFEASRGRQPVLVCPAGDMGSPPRSALKGANPIIPTAEGAEHATHAVHCSCVDAVGRATCIMSYLKTCISVRRDVGTVRHSHPSPPAAGRVQQRVCVWRARPAPCSPRGT